MHIQAPLEDRVKVVDKEPPKKQTEYLAPREDYNWHSLIWEQKNRKEVYK